MIRLYIVTGAPGIPVVECAARSEAEAIEIAAASAKCSPHLLKAKEA
jgi:hypothetical protein